MLVKIKHLQNSITLSVVQLASIHGGEEETFCTDDRRDFLLECNNF